MATPDATYQDALAIGARLQRNMDWAEAHASQEDRDKAVDKWLDFIDFAVELFKVDGVKLRRDLNARVGAW